MCGRLQKVVLYFFVMSENFPNQKICVRKILHFFLYNFLFLSILFLNVLFINFWLYWIFVATRGFSLVAVSMGYSLVVMCGLLHFGGFGFSCCKAQAPGCSLSSCGTQASLLQGGDDPVHVPCINRQILNHWTTTEALGRFLKLWWIEDEFPWPMSHIFLHMQTQAPTYFYKYNRGALKVWILYTEVSSKEVKWI